MISWMLNKIINTGPTLGIPVFVLGCMFFAPVIIVLMWLLEDDTKMWEEVTEFLQKVNGEEGSCYPEEEQDV